MSQTKETYPRPLRGKERDLLEFVLPSNSHGYKKYLDMIDGMVVLAEGRRGKGNFVLGHKGDVADIISPLPPVIAYGMVYTTADGFSITVHECIDDQIDVEIISNHEQEIPEHFEEKKRWTYSTWRPGLPSPETGSQVREVSIDDTVWLALVVAEKRIWLYDTKTEMNQLIPVTNFHNELMRYKKIRDPKVALNARLMFDNLGGYSDEDLRTAFIAYNKIKRRVEVTMQEQSEQHSRVAALFKKAFGKKQP